MTKKISKENVPDLLKKLDAYDIYAPNESGGLVSYKLTDGNPTLEFSNSRKPPKEVFFPQTEKMFDFTVKGSKITDVTEPERSERPILLFGTRPCDARAATMLDTVFNWDYIDPYYVDRRKNAVVISLGCKEPEDSCFCTSVGGNPSSTEGSDMLWTDIGDKYVVEPLTEKGESIISSGEDLFSDAGDEDVTAASECKETAEAGIMRHMSLDGVRDALEKSFESPYWEEFANRCIGCGICTLLCPTCHCFDISDIASKGKAWRERTWDTCQDPYYSVHASSHNPRPGKTSRQRNRIYHKFLYMDKNLDVIGCVGCGRCISGCPVNIDIVEVVEGVKEACE